MCLAEHCQFFCFFAFWLFFFQGTWSNFEGRGGGVVPLVIRYWGGTRHLFLLTISNSKNIGGCHVTPRPPCSAVPDFLFTKTMSLFLVHAHLRIDIIHFQFALLSVLPLHCNIIFLLQSIHKRSDVCLPVAPGGFLKGNMSRTDCWIEAELLLLSINFTNT